ncbi:MAG: NINE protein [Lachnospiraceae bacterium]|nr:NINE protein [Lachnospiraceae bacterium]
MMANVCPQCGAGLDPTATECKYCGEKIVPAFNAQYQQSPYGQPMGQPPYGQPPYGQPPYGQPVYQQQPMYPNGVVQPYHRTGIDANWPIKSKLVAGLLGIFLGGLGIHKFYLGNVGAGIVYLLFCWTYIPALIGFCEGIGYLCSNDMNFCLRNHCRVD